MLRVDEVERVVLKRPAVARVLPQDVAARAPVLAREADGQAREDEVGVEPAVAALVPPVAAHLQVRDPQLRQLGTRDDRAVLARVQRAAVGQRLLVGAQQVRRPHQARVARAVLAVVIAALGGDATEVTALSAIVHDVASLGGAGALNGLRQNVTDYFKQPVGINAYISAPGATALAYASTSLVPVASDAMGTTATTIKTNVATTLADVPAIPRAAIAAWGG